MWLYSKLFVAGRFFSCPLEVLFMLLIFILNKNFAVSPLQLTLLASVKPMSSLFAFYVSSAIFDHPHRIRRYLVINNLLGCLPCLLYPFMDNVWFYLGSYIVFMVTTRAIYPAWNEILKRSVQGSLLVHTISIGNSVYYFMGIIVSPFLCFLMDQQASIWRYLFVSLAVFKLLNLGLVLFLQSNMKMEAGAPPVFNPFKKGWTLLKKKPAFAHYLVIFFLGGAGVVASHAILPYYFKDSLHLSYSELGLAISFCKGISFVATSTSWSKYTSRVSLYYLTSLASLLAIPYFLLTIAASHHTAWLYLAYICYGIMMAGIELSWNLSGLFFSGSEESTVYSSLNLVLAGLRGCICPFLGTLLFTYTGAIPVFIISMIISLIGILYGLWVDRRYEVPFTPKTSAGSLA